MDSFPKPKLKPQLAMSVVAKVSFALSCVTTLSQKMPELHLVEERIYHYIPPLECLVLVVLDWRQKLP